MLISSNLSKLIKHHISGLRRCLPTIYNLYNFSNLSPSINNREPIPVLLSKIEKVIQEAGGSRLMEASSLIKILTLYFSMNKGRNENKNDDNHDSKVLNKIKEIEEIIQDAYLFVIETYVLQESNQITSNENADLSQKSFGELVFALEELVNSFTNNDKDDKKICEKARVLFEKETINKILPFFKHRVNDVNPYIREILKIIKLAGKKGWNLGELPKYRVGLIILGTPIKSLFSNLKEALEDSLSSKENTLHFYNKFKEFVLEENKISKTVIEANQEEIAALMIILNTAEKQFENESDINFWKEIKARTLLYIFSRNISERSPQNVVYKIDSRECEASAVYINKMGILSKPTMLNLSLCVETLKKSSSSLFHFYFSFLENNPEQLLFEVLLTTLFKKRNHHIIPLRFINFIQDFILKNPNQFSLKLQVFIAGKSLEVSRLNLKFIKHLEEQFMEAKIENLELTTISKFAWICIIFGINDSNVFLKFSELLQNKFAALENQKNWFNDHEFTASFFWSIENSTHKYSLNFYKSFFTHIKNSKMLENAPLTDFSTICYSISCFYVSNLESQTRIIIINELAEYVEEYLVAILKKFTEKGEINKGIVGAIDFNKIFQFILTRKYLKPSENIQKLHKAFENYWQVKQLSKAYEYSTTNNLEIDVGAVLKKIGIPFEEEVMISIYRVDFLINKNIVMEIFGPKHYTRFSKISKPRDNIKKFHLEKMGYKYVEIPVHDFKGIFFSRSDKRMEFIYQKLGIKPEDLKGKA